MKTISLRWRLTLVTVAVLTAICAAVTVYSMVNARQMISPVSDNLEVLSLQIQVVSDIAGNLATEFTEDYPNIVGGGTAEASDDSMLYTYIINYDEEGGDSDAPWLEEGYSYEDATLAISAIEAGGVVLVDHVEDTFETISIVQRSFNLSSLIFMILMVLLGGILVYIAAGYALKPVNVLSRDIGAIGGEQLNHRVEPGTGAEEINRLAASFNDMLERLEEAFAAQKRFSTAAAHELKTPLAVIRANIDVLEMEQNPGTEEYTETFEVVKRQTERMSRLVDDLFSMSSLRECDLEELNQMDSIVHSVVQELTQAAKEKGITISVYGEKGIVRGNQVMLSRAISNLVENAIRYNVPGGDITVECERKEEEMVIRVSDTGPGISEEHLDSIFDPFYREDPSRSRKLGGAGLGLAIAAEIVQLHGGSICAENGPEGGAVFTLVLPRTGEEQA